MSPLEWVSAVERGDEVAINDFVRHMQPRVQRAVAKMGIPTDDVPDVGQEVLIEVLRQLTRGQFQHRSDLFSWIYPIVRGRAFDYWRRAQTRTASHGLSFEDMEPSDASRLSSAPEQEALVRLDEAKRSLPSRLQLVLQWRYADDVAVDAIAQRLNVSTKRTRTLLTTAKQELRARLA